MDEGKAVMIILQDSSVPNGVILYRVWLTTITVSKTSQLEKKHTMEKWFRLASFNVPSSSEAPCTGNHYHVHHHFNNCNITFFAMQEFRSARIYNNFGIIFLEILISATHVPCSLFGSAIHWYLVISRTWRKFLISCWLLLSGIDCLLSHFQERLWRGVGDLHHCRLDLAWSTLARAPYYSLAHCQQQRTRQSKQQPRSKRH